MRAIRILAAGAVLAIASAANAQEPSTQPPAAAPSQPKQAVPTIQSINIVDMSELPEATQKQVNDVVAQRSEQDLQKLRSSIDATPEISSALRAKGLSAQDVIAASLAENGALTLVTQKKPG